VQRQTLVYGGNPSIPNAHRLPRFSELVMRIPQ
jgi:hypothetical protein